MEAVVAALALVLAAIPAMLFLRNLKAYNPAPNPHSDLPAVSVLIPARNEERTIGASVSAVLANRGVQFEVLVLDDQSSDRTAAVLHDIAAADSRLKVIRGGDLPAGWCGKQYACARLAREARYPLLCFIDADVKLRPDALARMASFVQCAGVDLASGVPLQETVTTFEKLLIPLIHFVLLAFLPLDRMRRSGDPSCAAGCGQLFIARGEAYRQAGGHGAVRETRHDGLNLPRAFRRAGFKTDLFDATDVATCRMYRSAGEVWDGLRKNATEGLGSPRLIVPATLVLAMGQVAPFLLAFATDGGARAVSIVAMCFAYIPRVAAVRRFHQPVSGALLHPVSIVLLLAIQWQALARHLLGGQVEWKGRAYGPADT
jgi:hypothetical protein